MFKTLVLMLLCITISSCNKKDITEPPFTGQITLSKWEWIKSEIIWPNYDLTTPQSVGYSHQLEFINDSQIKIFYADTLQNFCEYVIENNSIIICNSSYGFEMKSDTLILSQVYVDGPIKYYKKL